MRHLSMGGAERKKLMERRARGIARMLGQWRTLEDVLMCSIESRRRAYLCVLRDVRASIERHGTPRYPGHERAFCYLRALRWATTVVLHSPRYSLHACNLSFESSPWRTLLESERRDGAAMSFFGIPWSLFFFLVHRFDALPMTLKGRHTKLTNMDRLALALHYMTTTSRLKELVLVFGVVMSIVQRELWRALFDLRRVLFAVEDAHCRLPTEKEAIDYENAKRARYGDPPLGVSRPFVLYMDGTQIPVSGVSSKEVEQMLSYYGGKHQTVNNVLCFDQFGHVVWYIVCAPGAFHDARLAEPFFAKMRTLAFNPHRLGVVVDSGFTGHDADGNNGEAAVFRPLDARAKAGNVSEVVKQWSAYLVTIRQANEWSNGALKSSWPRIVSVMDYNKIDKLHLLMEVAIHLHNLRTRRVGFNQLKTVFMPYVNERFKQQLLNARANRGEEGLKRYFETVTEDAERMERALDA